MGYCRTMGLSLSNLKTSQIISNYRGWHGQVGENVFLWCILPFHKTNPQGSTKNKITVWKRNCPLQTETVKVLGTFWEVYPSAASSSPICKISLFFFKASLMEKCLFLPISVKKEARKNFYLREKPGNLENLPSLLVQHSRYIYIFFLYRFVFNL